MVLILNRRILTRIQGYVDGTKHTEFEKCNCIKCCRLTTNDTYAMFGHLSLIRLNQHNKWTDEGVDLASEYGYIHIIKWFFKHRRQHILKYGGNTFSRDTIQIAARYGHLNILRFYVLNNKLLLHSHHLH